jgi:hypothetical protein
MYAENNIKSALVGEFTHIGKMYAENNIKRKDEFRYE